VRRSRHEQVAGGGPGLATFDGEESTMGEALRMFYARRYGRWELDESIVPRLQRLGRAAVVAVALVVLGYCVRSWWGTLQQLRHIRLSEYRSVADVLTVGDVLLGVIGWGLAKEIVRGVGRR
jgi:hypothetical protein